MKNYRKILAGVLATSMVLGSSTVALAAGEGGQTKGSGKVEGQAKQEIFSVVLPTEDDYKGAFDYVLDPMQLIDSGSASDKFDATKYGFESGASIFFYNKQDTTGGLMNYKSTSDKMTVQNKSNVPVELTVSLKASAVDGITFTNDNTFGGGGSADTSLYLALSGQKYTVTTTNSTTPSTDGAADLKPINNNGVASITTTLAELKGETPGTDKPFIIQWNPIRNGYEFIEDPAAKKETNYYEFQVTGKCNVDPAADWFDVLQTGDTPELEIIWSIENPLGAKVVLTQGTKTIDVTNMVGGQTFKSITVSDGTNTSTMDNLTITTGSDWNEETKEGSLSIVYSDAWKAWMKDKLITITVNFNDGSSRSVTVIGA